jgi:5-methylthioadenosine/S-adenosylhomocysteine deaminase
MLINGDSFMKKRYSLIFTLIVSTLTVCVYGQAQDHSTIDLLITNGMVITMNPARTVLGNGTIAINDGVILAVETSNDALKNKFKAKKVLNAKGKLVIPGLINTHTHAAMTIFRGFADDLPLQEWLENHIWPAETKYIDAKTVRIGTRLAIIEMIRSGTTTFNDMYFFEDEVAKVAKEIGIRAVVGEGIIDFPTPNNKTPEKGLEYTEKLIQKWQNDPLITVAVACHAPYTCSPDLLKKTKALSDKYGVPYHIHVSETKTEVDDIQKKYGFTPVGYLENLGILDDNVIAAHAVHLTKKDIELMVKQKVGMSHNPASNMKLASGIAPVPDLLANGAEVGLGTDGAASNNDLNMFEEMDITAKLHKVIKNDPTVMNAKSVLEIATIGGAKVLGLDDQVGSLEKGKKADIVIIDLNKPHLTPFYNSYSHIVYAVDAADVETVIVNGKVIMEDRKLLTVDEEKAMQELQALADQIKAKQ